MLHHIVLALMPRRLWRDNDDWQNVAIALLIFSFSFISLLLSPNYIYKNFFTSFAFFPFAKVYMHINIYVIVIAGFPNKVAVVSLFNNYYLLSFTLHGSVLS